MNRKSNRFSESDDKPNVYDPAWMLHELICDIYTIIFSYVK